MKSYLGRSRGPFARAGLIAACALGVAAATVATWYAWLGWDNGYQIDPATDVASGPYEAWQVIGCVITLIALALAVGVWIHPLLPLAVMPLAFTIAWSIDAASKDDSGLWGVGAFGILLGSLAGAGLIAAVARALRRRDSSGRAERSVEKGLT